ncbi:MAG: T9SS type A sorting domain-containing protein [Flavobacterium sp.]|nr:T9SS type A sorting domain-containing protein [Flavobacterium sp.]
MKVKNLFCLLLFSFFSQLSSQTLSLDSSFGNNGQVVNSFDVGNDVSTVTVIQDDGKILVCGLKTYSLAGNVYLARYNENGSLDLNFGNNGIVYSQIVTESGGNRIMKLLPNGKILVTGSKSISNNLNFYDFAIAQYNSNGSIDTTFGTNGIVITDINGNGNEANGIDVQSDGKIIVAGNTYINGIVSLDVFTTLVRYFPDGTIDTSFGIDGKVMLNLLASNSQQYLWDIKIRNDDTILLGVTTSALETTDYFRNIALLKVNNDGSPDLTFGTNGAVITDFGGQDLLYAIDEYQDNIFVAGYSRFPDYKMILSKYLSNGTLDTTFGTEGKVITNKDASSLNDGLYSMKIQGNGKILCSGWTGSFVNMDALLIQFNADGSIDNDFNQIGFTTTDFDGINNSNFSLATQSDGKIVCSGKRGDYLSYDSTLLRYQVDALATNQFNESNHFSISPNPFANKINVSLNLDQSETLSADLIDCNGRKIQNLFQGKSFLSGKNAIEIQMPESLANGIYFVEVLNGTTKNILKIIK